MRVIFGHREVSPETQTFSDGRPVPLHVCKNSLLYYRLAEPFSDTGLCTYRAAWRVRAHVGHQASDCFSWTEIFSSVLVTGFYTYPEHTPSWSSSATAAW